MLVSFFYLLQTVQRSGWGSGSLSLCASFFYITSLWHVYIIYITEKPFTSKLEKMVSHYRASELMSSFHVFFEFSKKNNKKQTYQFPQGYNIHRLQVHHLTLIHNKYLSTLYLYTYIHTYMNCSSQLY